VASRGSQYLSFARRTLASDLSEKKGFPGRAFLDGDEQWLPERSASQQRFESTDIVLYRYLPEVAFGCICVIIAAISVHDAMLLVLHAQVLDERNPFGRWVIDWSDGNVWPLVVLKLAGTSITCSLLILMFRWKRQLAFAAAVGVAIFQLALLAYLSLG
jgi:hypothetical protein